jgi:hypothetical protein
VKISVRLVSEFVPLVDVFVSAIRAFQFRAAVWEFRFRRLEKVYGIRLIDHGMRKLEVAIVAPQSPACHLSP